MKHQTECVPRDKSTARATQHARERSTRRARVSGGGGGFARARDGTQFGGIRTYASRRCAMNVADTRRSRDTSIARAAICERRAALGPASDATHRSRARASAVCAGVCHHKTCQGRDAPCVDFRRRAIRFTQHIDRASFHEVIRLKSARLKHDDDD